MAYPAETAATVTAPLTAVTVANASLHVWVGHLEGDRSHRPEIRSGRAGEGSLIATGRSFEAPLADK